jgi:hypothetical protein
LNSGFKITDRKKPALNTFIGGKTSESSLLKGRKNLNISKDVFISLIKIPP